MSTKYQKSYFFIFLLALIFLQTAWGQKPDVFRLEKISPADFNIKSPLIDTSTGAIVLANVGISSVENIDNQWKIVFKRIKRVKILSNAGFENLTWTIHFSGSENGDGKLKTLKATTYNLVNGRVEATTVPEKDIFLISSKNNDRRAVKFTFPNAKIGSIVEFIYSIRIWDISTLPTWDFQGDDPVLWSEYSTILPDNFNYAFSVQGNLPFFATSSDSVSKEMWNGRGNIEVMLYTKRWSMKDVPPLKKEPFVYDPDSYKSKISFQLSIYPLSYLRSQSVLQTWQQFSHWLLIDKNFAGLGMDTLWIKIAVNEIVSKASDSLDAARRIFAYVRDSFRCTENDWTSNDLQAVYDNKEGTDGEINTLLLAMLRKVGFRANPVLLSTRSNGLLNPKYPIYDRINYIVIQLAIDKNLYYLDASNRYHAFGKIPADCYNGPAMVIDSLPYAVNFSPDSIKENSMHTLFIYNSGKDSLEADCTYKPGFIESVDLRDWMEKNKSSEYFDEIGKSYLMPVNWKSQSVENLQNKEESPSIHYTLNFSMADKETVYFDPLIGQSKTKNPFYATSRKYPIQLDNSFNKAYILDMEIPKGFQVVELPKSTKVQLNDGDGSFEYSMTMADGHIQFRYKLSLNKAVFPADNYEDLRNFFAMVTKKESEVVVFKKTQ